jgi:hypothetical protein
MNNVQLQNLARVGAQARLATLDTERKEMKMFPDLRASQQPTAGKNGSAPPAARKRKGMSLPAARHTASGCVPSGRTEGRKEGTIASPPTFLPRP